MRTLCASPCSLRQRARGFSPSSAPSRSSASASSTPCRRRIVATPDRGGIALPRPAAGFHVIDRLEERVARVGVRHAGQIADVARGAIDQLQVAWHHPDHPVPQHAPQAHHRAGRERVEQHLRADARHRVEQERRGGTRSATTRSADVLTGRDCEARRSSGRPDGDHGGGGADGPARPRGPRRIRRRVREASAESAGVTTAVTPSPAPDRASRESVEPDAEAHQLAQADLPEHRTLSCSRRLVEQTAQVVIRPLDRLRGAAQQAGPGGLGRVGLRREQERPGFRRLRRRPTSGTPACRRWGSAPSCPSARRCRARGKVRRSRAGPVDALLGFRRAWRASSRRRTLASSA